MPAAQRMTAEEYLARPYDPREHGWEPFDRAIVDMRVPRLAHGLVCNTEALDSPLLPGFALALDAVFGE